MPFLFQPWHILLAALCGMVNERQRQIIEFQNAQIEAVLRQLAKKRLLLNDDQRRLLVVKAHAIGRNTPWKTAGFWSNTGLSHFTTRTRCQHRHSYQSSKCKTPPLGAERQNGAAIGRVSTTPLRPTPRQLSRNSASLHRAYATDFADLKRLRLLTGRTQANTKAEVEAAVRRRPRATVRRPADGTPCEPAVAANHPDKASCRASGVVHGTTWVIAIPILTPLPNIAVLVVQTPSIGMLTAYWMSLVIRIPHPPSVIA